MPRLTPRLLRRAKQHSPHLATLLPACRDIPSAQNELRWLTNFINDSAIPMRSRNSHLAALCSKRGHGVPLQYILGSQPFGQLDMKCRPGVLIPRPETEAYTYHLAHLIKSGKLKSLRLTADKDELNVVDFCTGTGCIPLLLFSLLHQSFGGLHVRGVDISPQAIQLAKDNIAYNFAAGNLPSPTAKQSLSIAKADIFKPEEIERLNNHTCDVLISNPPYISEDVWKYGRGQIGYSVKKFEPRLALVPDTRPQPPSGWNPADIFYFRLLDVAHLLKAKTLLFEVGDEAQACRVLAGFSQHQLAKGSRVEVWRDWPDIDSSDNGRGLNVTKKNGQNWAVPTIGTGNIRSILIETHRASAPTETLWNGT